MAFIRSYIGNAVRGWIMSLVMAFVAWLVKRAMQKATQGRAQAGQPRQGQTADPFFSQKQQPASAQTSGKAPWQKVQPYRQLAVQDAIYQGMRKSELLAAYGQPDDKQRPTFDKEVWTYIKHESNDNEVSAMTVTLNEGVVVDWAEK